MLQAISTVHTFSVLNHTLYFGFLALLALVVCPGWYKFGRLQLASVSPAPTFAPVRQRVTLYRKGLAVVLQLTGVLILGSLEVRSDSVAVILAAKFT